MTSAFPAEPGGASAVEGLALRPVRVWDAPTRLVHWFFPPLVAFAWWSAHAGRLDWHLASGALTMALVVFRLSWGVVGGSTARFAHFVRGPRTVWRYLRNGDLIDRTHRMAGHTPPGGWSVVTLLGALAVIVGSGLIAVDTDGLNSGPLAKYVSFDLGRGAAHLHGWTFDILLGVIALHLAAIGLYLVVKRENLIGAMISGRKRLGPDAAPLRPTRGVALIVCLVVAAALTAIAFLS